MSNLRPDEKATNAEIEKHQAQDARLKRGTKIGLEVASTAAAVPFAGRVATSLASKVMPFLNEYVPVNLALKGIEKVSPNLGKFLKKGIEQGLDLNDGLAFIKESISNKEAQPEKETKQTDKKQNIINQYSPELFQFLKDEIAKGITPKQASGMARLASKGFHKQISDLEKHTKTKWDKLVENIFGSGITSKQEAVKNFNQKKGLREQFMEQVQQSPAAQQQQQPHPNSAQGQQMARQQGGGQDQGSERIMSALDKLLKLRGG